MPDLHTPPFFGALLSDQGCDQRHNDSIAKIVQIQDDEDPPATERFEQIERQTQEVCMEMGQRVVKGVLEDRDARTPARFWPGSEAFPGSRATAAYA